MTELAGVFDPSGVADRRAVSAALGGEDRAAGWSGGPLTVAWTGGDSGVHSGLLCVLDGCVSNLAVVAESVNEPPGGTPHQILATAYRRLGENLVGRLGGEFALLLWDPHTNRGALARDRLGARPLFLWSDGGRLCFASEVRDLLGLLPRRPAPDRVAIVHWLVAAGPRGGRTLYERVVVPEPGQYVGFAERRWALRRYWEPRYAGTLAGSRDELAAEVRDRIGRSVRMRLGESRAVGILLSGGVDSASLAGVAAADPAARPALAGAYSAVFPRHPSTDESALIDRLVAELDLRSVRIAVESGSMVAGLLEYLGAWQLPLMDQNNVFMQPLLRRAAADGAEVVLDGEGGDEVFGAARGLIADHVRRGRLREATRLTARLPGAGDHPPWRPLLRLLAVHGVRGALPPDLHRGLRRARGAERFAPPWLRGDSARVLLDTDDPWAWKRLEGPRWWAQLADALTSGVAARGVHDHARRRARMAGVEARHPFLGAELVDFVLRLPPALSFDPHLSRPLLRAAVAGLVPDEVRLRRRKTYFDAPFQETMAGADLGAVRRAVLDPNAEIGAFVDLHRVRRDLLDVPPTRHPLGARFWAASAWRLVTAECWLRSQGDPDFPQRALQTWDLQEPRYELRVATR